MLWIKNNYIDKLNEFIDFTYKYFWKRELNLEDESVLLNILKEIKIDSKKFIIWKNDYGDR